MKISYNWLIETVKMNIPIEEISKILTDTGLEVDGFEKLEGVKGGLKGVIVGEVLTCDKHPDADKLNVTTIQTGNEILQVVCGAPNVATGQKVMLATIGTVLYTGDGESFKIKKSKIRGVESFGMLCSEVELGLGEGHDGILILDPSAQPGTPAADYLQLEEDYQIEIGLTPNRADAMGIIGVARDVIAYLNFHQGTNLELKREDLSDILNPVSQDRIVEVNVLEEQLCPRYVGVSIKGVKVGESPSWLQNKLRAIGLSPINNIVDATNYVMRELGTPLHAFDFETLAGQILVRKAKEGETITTLDQVERKLDTEDLVIANATDALAIAGVFGGKDSGISDQTVDLFIESAYFNAVSVRKTAKRQGLNTDASFRYERGVDPDATLYALQKVVKLIREIAGGEVAMKYIDTNATLAKGNEVTFRSSYCNQLLGTEISQDELLQIFKSLDIEVLEYKGDIMKLRVPDYRVDVTREVDVIEEVLRIYGYNKVEMPENLHTVISYEKKPNLEKVKNKVASLLVSNGYFEMMNNSLTSSSYVEKLGKEVLNADENIKLLNPLSQDLDVMRQSLLFSALEAVVHNQNRQNPNVKVFEFGTTYKKVAGEYVENKRLIILATGNKNSEQWNSAVQKSTFFTVKGVVKAVFEILGLWNQAVELSLENSLLSAGETLGMRKKDVAYIGKISSEMKAHFGIKNEVYVADIDWSLVSSFVSASAIVFEEIPKTFEVRRDFSLLLDQAVSFQQIEKIATGVDKKILKRVNLFDVYEGKNLEEGKKSYAISFHFQDKETLKDEQVDVIMQKIRQKLEADCGATLR